MINSYDIFMLVVIGVFMLLGARKGLLGQAAAWGAILIGTWATWNWRAELAPYVGLKAPFDQWVAGMAIYFVVGMIIWWTAGHLRQRLKQINLAGFDRQMGALIGLAQGVVVCLICTALLVMVSPTWREKVVPSRTAEYVRKTTQLAIENPQQTIPLAWHERMMPWLEDVEESLDETADPTEQPQRKSSPLEVPGGLNWPELNREINKLFKQSVTANDEVPSTNSTPRNPGPQTATNPYASESTPNPTNSPTATAAPAADIEPSRAASFRPWRYNL